MSQVKTEHGMLFHFSILTTYISIKFPKVSLLIIKTSHICAAISLDKPMLGRHQATN